MSTTRNPYAAALGNRDPYQALGDTPERIRAIVERWPAERFERSYAPGKWSARQVTVCRRVAVKRRQPDTSHLSTSNDQPHRTLPPSHLGTFC